MIKNLIFDIGNVLTDFRWREMLKEKGITGEAFDRIGEVTVHSKYWPEYDRGVWTEKEILDAFISLAPDLEKEIHTAFDDFYGMVTMRDYACDWLRELKAKGFNLYYLSNFSKKAEEECADSIAFIPLMDGGILSYKDKLIKPDRAIYELLLSRYNLKAEECVFFDDLPANVEAACKVGINGIVFVSKEQAEADLAKLV